MIIKKLFFFSILSVIALSGCKSTGDVSKNTPGKKYSSPGKKELSEDDRNNLIYLFYNANKEKITGNVDKAADLFAQCIRIDGRNDASMYELAQIYTGKKKINDALFFARSAAEINPENNWYQLLLAELLQQSGKYNEAVAVYEQLVKESPERLDYYFDLANAYLFAGKPEEAIKVFDKLEGQMGVDKQIILQKKSLYLKLGKTDKAAAELEKLIAANPKDMESYSLLVELYQVNNMKDKAFETIKRMQQINPDHPRVFLSLAEYYRSNNENEKSFEELKKAFASQQLDSDVKLRVLTSYMKIAQADSAMLDQSLELSKVLAETHPSEALTHAVHGDFLRVAKKFEEAGKEYRASLAIDNKNEMVWEQFLNAELILQNYDSLLKESEEALSLFPNNAGFYLFNGIAKSQKKQYEEAVKILLSGSKLVIDNELLLRDFYSQLGDSHHELKNNEESDKYYEKALAIDPKNSFILNNYSYYLSVRGEKLDKAEAMSKLSNELTPNQASFQDTYAWILYKEGKFNDAKEWLEKAMTNGGDKNGTILEHYGDVLFKLGQTEKAIEFWNKAKAAGEASDLIDKKIAEKKLYE
ncbi:MAG TPA: tetratricopeptide repeat protein [Bacteroidia bacterium]|nr:tetratricopeptide repeat protein [Bacteroidia bacterium]